MNQEKGISIGTVARLVGVSVHALRAWEKRYALELSERDQNQRRIFSKQSLEKIKLLKRGIDAGYKISELATLSVSELTRILIASEPHNDDEIRKLKEQKQSLQNKRLLVFGAALSQAFYRQGLSGKYKSVKTLDELLLKVRLTPLNYKGILLEFFNLDEEFESFIYDLKLSLKINMPILVFTDSDLNSPSIKRLTSSGVRVENEDIQSVNLLSVLKSLQQSDAGKLNSKDISLNSMLDEANHADTHSSDHSASLSPEQLDILYNRPTNILCECPQHLAKIYEELDSFIDYVSSCEQTSPKDASLHQHMHKNLLEIRQKIVLLTYQVADFDGIAFGDIAFSD